MHQRALSLLLAGLVVLVTASPAAAQKRSAQERKEVAAQVETLRDQVSEASAEEAAVLDQLDELEGRRRQLETRVGALDGELAGVQTEARAAQARLDVVQADFVRTQMDLVRAQGGLAAASAELRQQAVAAYLGNPTASAADSMLRSGNLRELAATSSYLESVAQARKKVVDRYRALRDSTEALQGSIEAKKDGAKAQWDVVMAKQSALEAVRSELETTRRQALGEEAQREAVLTGVRSRVAEFEGQIAGLRGESDSLAGLLQGVQVGRPFVGGGNGTFSPPIPGAALSSLFGPRVHPIFGTVRMHNGVDFRGGTGTPIRAAGGGTVVYAGPRGGYGNTVVIDHGGSLATLYAHQSVMYVTTGASVAPGQVIGAVGSTGFSTGPHLHFEVRLNGTPVNPLGYL